MQTYLDFEHKTARVVVTSINGAGWLGFDFARGNPDLTQAGWKLHFFPGSKSLPSYCGLPTKHSVVGAVSLARAIRAGPPKSCCHDCCCKGE